jgi:hypothetical protein
LRLRRTPEQESARNPGGISSSFVGFEKQQVGAGAESLRNSFLADSRAQANGVVAARNAGSSQPRWRYLRLIRIRLAQPRRERNWRHCSRSSSRMGFGLPLQTGRSGMNFWVSALALNALMTLGASASQETVGASLDALVRCRAAGGFVACPSEVSVLRPASSVRSQKVRLAVGGRHGELGERPIPSTAAQFRESSHAPWLFPKRSRQVFR